MAASARAAVQLYKRKREAAVSVSPVCRRRHRSDAPCQALAAEAQGAADEERADPTPAKKKVRRAARSSGCFVG